MGISSPWSSPPALRLELWQPNGRREMKRKTYYIINVLKKEASMWI